MTKRIKAFTNPYRPGAGHMPPYLAGRKKEISEFKRLLEQNTIIENLVLTGLRGVGKTVLLETLKPIALADGWHWVGEDISESASLNETNLAIRFLADLSVLTSSIDVPAGRKTGIGFATQSKDQSTKCDYEHLTGVFNSSPGLISDKLKAVLEYVWSLLKEHPTKGLVFAYDEAQNLADHAEQDQFPLSLLLDMFQSIQRKGIPFMLVLTGLPTLFPKLVEARTFAERMFHVVFLDRLTESESKKAILEPLKEHGSPVMFTDESVERIIRISAGYPYFVQFICREVFDAFIQKVSKEEEPTVPGNAIIAKLDRDFFAGRWARATDRQRELLRVVAMLPNSDQEFTVQEIVEQSKKSPVKQFSSSHVNQMLTTLSNSGLVFKNRHGRYSFAVPLMGQFIRRQYGMEEKTA